MKGTSKVIMGATLAMVVALAIVLGLVLVLLADLYCSLLLRRIRRRKMQIPTSTTLPASATTTTNAATNDSSLRNLYAQGVLHAPRSFLFPSISSNDKNELGVENQNSKSQFFESRPIERIVTKDGGNGADAAGSSGDREHFVYICNPIYDNEARGPNTAQTPFETPDSSPSHLESTDEFSGGEKSSPPVMPMKKLQAEACSVSLRDASSLATSGSESNTNNDISSSSSGSPSTSPSW